MPPLSSTDKWGGTSTNAPSICESVGAEQVTMTTSHEQQILACALAPGRTAQQVLADLAHLHDRDLTDPRDGVLLEAMRAAASNGLVGGACVLAQLQDDGHLERDVDRRLADRLAELVTTNCQPLQARHHALRILQAAEVRIVRQWATDALERAHVMPHDDVRELERELWRRLRDVHERLDALHGTSRADLRAVKSA